jgi:hypothetical protein
MNETRAFKGSKGGLRTGLDRELDPGNERGACQRYFDPIGQAADELPDEEVCEWCTEWLLANGSARSIAEFIACAMSVYPGLDVLVQERLEREDDDWGGDDEW